MKKGYYRADTTSGVYFLTDILEESDTDILSAVDFQKSLSSLEETEEITTFFDEETEEIFNEIEKEFGIN